MKEKQHNICWEYNCILFFWLDMSNLQVSLHSHFELPVVNIKLKFSFRIYLD